MNQHPNDKEQRQTRLTADGLDLAIATQQARQKLGELDVTLSIEGFIDLARAARAALASVPSHGAAPVAGRITSAYAYSDALDQVRIAIRYEDDTEEDRPATLLEAKLAVLAVPSAIAPPAKWEWPTEGLPLWLEEELKDGDRLCQAAGVQRTEGGRLPVAKIINALRSGGTTDGSNAK